MVVAFYFVTFIASVFMAAVNIYKNKKADTRFIIFSATVIISCFGRYLLSISETLELALVANNMIYVGGCFTAPIVVLIVVQCCNFKLHKALKFFLLGFATLIFGFSLTIGHSNIYYNSVTLSYKDGYHYLIKDYGPLHKLYPVLMLMCAAMLLYYVVIAIKNRNIISYRIVITVTVSSIVIMSIYILERVLHSTIEWIALGYLCCTIIMGMLFDRFNMYDMSINIAHHVERLRSYGYIVFDKKNNYVNANQFALELFPEINAWESDKKIKPEDTTAYNEIIKNIKELRKNPKTLLINDKFIYISISDISYEKSNRIVGYMVEMVDKTVEQKYLNTIESYNTDLKNEVSKKTKDILYIKDMMVIGMATMVESRDNSTGGHIKRTSGVVRIFSKHLNNYNIFGLTKEFLGMTTKAAPMHDLGKIAVDDKILRKQGKFTDEEYAEMKKHSAEGAKIVTDILDGVEDEEFVRIATNIAHYHHEKWNGKGYPDGLSGTDIPIEARIMALADVFDALVSKRCYKEAFSYDDAFKIIENDLGSHFDPELGKIFLECRTDLEDLYNSYNN